MMVIDGDLLVVRNAPIAARKLGVTGSLAAETAARIAGDAANAAAIAAEAGTRAAADTALQNQITALQQPVYERNMLLGGM